MDTAQPKLGRLMKKALLLVRLAVYLAFVFSFVPNFWQAVLLASFGPYLWMVGFAWGREKGDIEGSSRTHAFMTMAIAEGSFTQEIAQKLVGTARNVRQ